MNRSCCPSADADADALVASVVVSAVCAGNGTSTAPLLYSSRRSMGMGGGSEPASGELGVAYDFVQSPDTAIEGVRSQPQFRAYFTTSKRLPRTKFEH
jgi:hypothetical protein